MIGGDSISGLNVFNQNASGGGILSSGGRIGDSKYSGDVVIRMTTLDNPGRTKMIHLELDYISVGDTVVLNRDHHREYLDNTFLTFNPEQVSRAGN